MSHPATLMLKNDLSELARLCEFIDEFGGRAGLPSKTIADMHLALDEVVTNVISYAYPTFGEHQITIRLAIDADQMVVMEVEDDGQVFDPLTVGAPDLSTPLEERTVGGLGMHLVRQLTDSLDYRRYAGKNHLTMKRKLASREA